MMREWVMRNERGREKREREADGVHAMGQGVVRRGGVVARTKNHTQTARAERKDAEGRGAGVSQHNGTGGRQQVRS